MPTLLEQKAAAALECHNAGNYPGAIACYQEMLLLDPQNPTANNNIAVMLMRQGQHQEALPYLQAAFAVTPQDKDVRANLSRLLRHLGQHQALLALGESVAHWYIIEIAAACNLRCPSCPNGNFRDEDYQTTSRFRRGFMNLDLYRQIIPKLRQSHFPPAWFIFYNWGEPLLHPQVDEFIRIANEFGIASSISTNLSHELNLEKAIAAGPRHLKVSLSGSRQEHYVRTHTGGDIRIVKANMYRLRHYLDKYGCQAPVNVGFHLYKHNIGDYYPVKALCEELGFSFDPCMAYYCPTEKIARIVETGQLPEKDRELLDNLLVDIRAQAAIGAKYKDQVTACTIRNNQTIINYDGSVGLCCSTFDPAYSLAPSVLDCDIDAIQQQKKAHPFCNVCMTKGLHVTFGGSAPEGARQELTDAGNMALAALSAPFRF